MKNLKTLFLAALLVGAGVSGLGTDAWAQGRSDSKPAAAAAKKPGKTCSDLVSNSQAHKDCIQKQAKSTKDAKSAKVVKPTKPKAPVMKPTKAS